jgi:plastocyanin
MPATSASGGSRGPHIIRRPMRRLLATVALGAALAAGCGDDDEPSERSLTVQAGGRLEVVADEYSFDPARVDVTGAGSRARVNIVLDNRGSLAHNLKVFAGERELGGTPTFPGGRTEGGSVELEPGEYRMVCTVGDHADLGMTGTLKVQ